MSRSGTDPLDPGPFGFAHRGLHGAEAPENSLSAFRAAVAVGAGIETDVRLSADGVPMLFHDRDAMRMCGSATICLASRADELGALRLNGTAEPIPRLSDLLALVAGRVPLLLELKSEGNAERFARIVVDQLRAYAGRAGMMSFDPRVSAWLAAHAPHVRRGLVLSGRRRMLARRIGIMRARPQFLAVRQPRIADRWVARARRRMPVYCWTICTPADRAQAAVHSDSLIWEADGRP